MATVTLKNPRSGAAYTLETPKYWSMHEIEEFNKRAGLYFFEKDSMRFFSSRVCGQPFQGPGGVYFVTSERDRHSNGSRGYSVRRFDENTGDINTVGEFQGFSSAVQAQRAADGYAKNPLFNKTWTADRLYFPQATL